MDGLHGDQGGEGIRHRHRGVAGRSPRGFGSWLERRSQARIEKAERGHEPIERDKTNDRRHGPKLGVGQNGNILIRVQVLRQRLHRNLALQTIHHILRQDEHSWNMTLRPLRERGKPAMEAWRQILVESPDRPAYQIGVVEQPVRRTDVIRRGTLAIPAGLLKPTLEGRKIPVDADFSRRPVHRLLRGRERANADRPVRRLLRRLRKCHVAALEGGRAPLETGSEKTCASPGLRWGRTMRTGTTA